VSGLQEIILILLIIAILFYLPKRAGGDATARRRVRPRISLSGRIRLAIVASILYLLAAAYLFDPRHGDPLRFAVFGGGPVILGWAIYWVVLGYRRHRR
jgi:hypothetical protein